MSKLNTNKADHILSLNRKDLSRRSMRTLQQHSGCSYSRKGAAEFKCGKETREDDPCAGKLSTETIERSMTDEQYIATELSISHRSGVSFLRHFSMDF